MFFKTVTNSKILIRLSEIRHGLRSETEVMSKRGPQLVGLETFVYLGQIPPNFLPLEN